jgi:hypothetical protein
VTGLVIGFLQSAIYIPKLCEMFSTTNIYISVVWIFLFQHEFKLHCIVSNQSGPQCSLYLNVNKTNYETNWTSGFEVKLAAITDLICL